MTYVPDLGKIVNITGLVLKFYASKLSNIWPKDTSIPIFLCGGYFLLTKNLSMSTAETKNQYRIIDLWGVVLVQIFGAFGVVRDNEIL